MRASGNAARRFACCVSGEAGVNAEEAVLPSVPAARRKTLVAERGEDVGEVRYRFDIRTKGPEKAVFFDV